MNAAGLSNVRRRYNLHFGLQIIMPLLTDSGSVILMF